jgi:hypothetical protein
MITPRWSTDMGGDPDRNQAARALLLETSINLVQRVYQDGLGHGQQRPVVLLVDCLDEYGGPLARTLMDDATVDNQIQAFNGGRLLGSTVTLAYPFEYEEARDLISKCFVLPRLIFQPPPAQEIAVIVVAMGGGTGFALVKQSKP